MGMMIDDATLYMELYKRKLFNSVSDLDKDIEAYDIAIDTMHKYQKIAEIVKAWREVGLDYDSCDAMENIERLLDDGNIDNYNYEACNKTMTNGEVFTKIFPEFKIKRVDDNGFGHIEIYLGRIAGSDLEHRNVQISLEWWDSPYKELFYIKCLKARITEKDAMLAMLDKIRAEIEQNAYPIVHGVNNHELGMTLYGILQVIDKYKAEQEET